MFFLVLGSRWQACLNSSKLSMFCRDYIHVWLEENQLSNYESHDKKKKEGLSLPQPLCGFRTLPQVLPPKTFRWQCALLRDREAQASGYGIDRQVARCRHLRPQDAIAGGAEIPVSRFVY